MTPEKTPVPDTRYDPDSGKLYIPFDIRTEIIGPLNEVRELARTTANGLTTHLGIHDAEKQRKIEQRERILLWGKRLAGAVGGVVTVATTLYSMGIIH